MPSRQSIVESEFRKLEKAKNFGLYMQCQLIVRMREACTVHTLIEDLFCFLDGSASPGLFLQLAESMQHQESLLKGLSLAQLVKESKTFSPPDIQARIVSAFLNTHSYK